ncbi:MAG TPA: formate dehydrogenase, partial [Thauera sp.]|nr:formate dehydrogenase [Thauera sp.]
MSIRVYVPIDSSALSLGAEQVARAIRREAEARGIAIELVRNGSRGLFWLEPLVEVLTPQGRIAYGPVQAEDVPGLFEAGFHRGKAHALCHGPTEQIPFLARQERPLGHVHEARHG